MVLQILFRAFWKTQIFTETGDVHKVSVFGLTLTPIYPLKKAEIKNSQLAIQIIQNQSPISFQLSMKTIITFCSIWTFFGYDWVMGPGPKPLIIVSYLFFFIFLTFSDFFYFGPIFKCPTQRMERINWISRYRTLC